MSSEKIVTRAAVLWVDQEGIIHSLVNPGAEVKIDDMKEIIDAGYALVGQKKAPVLVDMREIRSSDRESREYTAGPEGEKVTTALAFLIKSKVGELIGNFFINFNNPRFPTKIFTAEDEALDWLRGYLNER